jgi:hypothetical protein
MDPIEPIHIAVSNRSYTNPDTVPVHPRVLAYWIAYFAHRITAVITDDTLSSRTVREWLEEITGDLHQFAVLDGQLDSSNQERARQLALAMHAFVFHDGPDPDEDPACQARCQPDWSAIFASPSNPSPPSNALRTTASATMPAYE